VTSIVQGPPDHFTATVEEFVAELGCLLKSVEDAIEGVLSVPESLDSVVDISGVLGFGRSSSLTGVSASTSTGY
jgi:hypothetical protein